MLSPVLCMELLALKMMKRITLTKIMGLQILFTRTMQKKQQQILILCFMQMMLYTKMKSQNFLKELIDYCNIKNRYVFIIKSNIMLF